MALSFPWADIHGKREVSAGSVDRLEPIFSSACVTRPNKPTQVLIENSNDRPDVARVAILGYN